MAKRAFKPKIEILYEYAGGGERVSECDLLDYLDAAAKISAENPGSETWILEVSGLDFAFGTVTFFIIFKTLEGVKNVTERDVVRAIKKMHEDQ
jgi:hypothetical protein